MGKTLRIVTIVCVLLCCAVLVLRVALLSYYPKDVKKTVMTAALENALAEGRGDDAFTQKPEIPYDSAKEGHFFFDHLLCVPSAGELQVTLRYNNSTLTDIAEDMGLSGVPAGDDERFSFWLRSGNRVYPMSESIFDKAFMYNYVRAVFDGVDFTHAADGNTSGYLYVDVYFGEADTEKGVPYGSLLVYIPEAPVKEVDLSK